MVDEKDNVEVPETSESGTPQTTSRKRGRPAIYTPEERIARKKERAKLRREKKKALKTNSTPASMDSDPALATETNEVYSEAPEEVPEPVTTD